MICFNTSDYVQLPGSWGGGASYTIEAWVKVLLEPNPLIGVGDIVSADAQQFTHTHIFHPIVANPNPNTDPSNAAYITGGSGGFTSAGIDGCDSLPLNAWRHIAAVWTPGNSRLFVNSVQQHGPWTQTWTTITVSSNVSIARGYLGGRYFTGWISKVAIYSHALTAARVAAHYAAANDAAYDTAVLADTPLGYWRLDEAVGSTSAVDSSGNGSNGTYHGTPYLAQPGPYGSDLAALFGDKCDDWHVGGPQW